MKPIIPTGEVKYYIEQFKRISQIFDEENVLYFSEGVQPVKEELLKIDKVDSTFVKYIKIPIYIYVSSNGMDIDILQVSNRHEITADEKRVDYYEIFVTDFAGNRTKKKLTSQYSLLTWFHTSIDRSSYNR